MTSASPPLSEVVDIATAADPVAAVVAAHAAGRPIALRTSGSTARPRSVVRTTASWFDSFDHVAALTGLTASSALWVPGPMAATMNLFASVLGRHVGARRVATPAEATHVHLTPHQLGRLVDEEAPVAGLHVTVAGDRLPDRLRVRALAAGARVSHYYGAAELSFVGWGTSAGDLRPFRGVEIEARDGELWVRSPYLCEGYAGEPGSLRRDAHGFATVGDRGLLEDGVLTVVGRGSAAVTTGGTTVPIAEVEAVLRPRVRGEVLVVGVPHGTLGQVVAAVLTDPGDLSAARTAARELLEPARRPRVWFHVAELPVTGAGKTDRARIGAMVARPGVVRLAGPGTGPGVGAR